MSKLRACRALFDERGFNDDERHRATLLRTTLNRPATHKVFVNVVSVAQSGLSRKMRLYILNGGDLLDVSGIAASLLAYPMRDGCMVVRGTGMDMVWDTLRRLAKTLYASERDGQSYSYRLL